MRAAFVALVLMLQVHLAGSTATSVKWQRSSTDTQSVGSAFTVSSDEPTRSIRPAVLSSNELTGHAASHTADPQHGTPTTHCVPHSAGCGGSKMSAHGNYFDSVDNTWMSGSAGSAWAAYPSSQDRAPSTAACHSKYAEGPSMSYNWLPNLLDSAPPQPKNSVPAAEEITIGGGACHGKALQCSPPSAHKPGKCCGSFLAIAGGWLFQQWLVHFFRYEQDENTSAPVLIQDGSNVLHRAYKCTCYNKLKGYQRNSSKEKVPMDHVRSTASTREPPTFHTPEPRIPSCGTGFHVDSLMSGHVHKVLQLDAIDTERLGTLGGFDAIVHLLKSHLISSNSSHVELSRRSPSKKERLPREAYKWAGTFSRTHLTPIILGQLDIAPRVLALWVQSTSNEVIKVFEKWNSLRAIIDRFSANEEDLNLPVIVADLIQRVNMSAALGVVVSDFKTQDVLIRKTRRGNQSRWETRMTDFDPPYSFVFKNAAMSSRVLISILPMTLRAACTERSRFAHELVAAVHAIAKEANLVMFRRDLQQDAPNTTTSVRDSGSDTHAHGLALALAMWKKRLEMVRTEVRRTAPEMKGNRLCQVLWGFPTKVLAL